jgi:oligopeptide/dipeptide ABC transporter ATP-binding protein
VKSSEQTVLLEVRDVRKWYPVSSGTVLSRTKNWIKAVDGVSFDIRRGETLGLVGESGCGKTTLGKLISGLERPHSGSIRFEGEEVLRLEKRELRRFRRGLQIIFQDPYDSLDPRLTIEQIIAEPLVVHRVGGRLDRKKRVGELLETVGLAPDVARRYPHEFSGGQRQRIGIARALALRPQFIVCDEPVSALDVSIQSQILNLLSDLKRDFNLTYLFIAHGLAVVKHISDRVAVMYLGKIVELARKSEIYRNPRHPYTKALMSTIPIPDPTVRRERIILEGDVPSAIHIPEGCRFQTRCPNREDCFRKKDEPDLVDIGSNHWVACHLLAAATTR